MKKDLVALAPNQKSEAEAWGQWYDDLKADFGKKMAKSIWVAYWNKRAGARSDANTRVLREKMQKEGVILDTTFVGSIVDGADGLLDTVGGIFSFGAGLGKVLAIGAGVAVLLLLVNVARKPIESAGAAANVMRAKAGA